MLDLLIKNIGYLATPEGSSVKAGREQGKINVKKDIAIGIKDGIITHITDNSNLPEANKIIDANNKLVTPGLVDSHTHLVFGGWRQNELELKLKGAEYLDILEAGGGILSTVRSTREASFDELYEKAKKISLDMLEYGTTTIEAKSGYGLDFDTEIKQLEIVKKLDETMDIDYISTYMGAHALPEEYENGEEYIDIILTNMLPYIKKNNLASYCDVFCETGVFDVELSRKLLLEARNQGFKLRIHADEIDPIGGGELAGEIGTDTAEHLIAATDEGIKLMAEAGTIGVLLPATTFYLGAPYARARDMLEAGMAIAIGSDFNPGSSPNFNMQLAMNIACLKYKMTPEEVLTAATLNGAAAVGMADKIGSIEIGKQGDIVIWDAPDLNYILYRFGNNLVETVIKKGLVYGGK